MKVIVAPAVPMFAGATREAAVRHDETDRIAEHVTGRRDANKTHCALGTKQGGIFLPSKPVAAFSLHGGIDRKDVTLIDDAGKHVIALKPANGVPENR